MFNWKRYALDLEAKLLDFISINEQFMNNEKFVGMSIEDRAEFIFVSKYGHKESFVGKLFFIEGYKTATLNITDAVEFAEWKDERYVNYKMKYGLYYAKTDLLKDISEATVFTTEQLYQIFLNNKLAIEE